MIDHEIDGMESLTWTASSTIRNVFTIRNRGLVITLEHVGTGNITGPSGVVKGSSGSSKYTGPEIADGKDEDGKSVSWLAVVVTAPDAQALFHPGDKVEFFKTGDP